MATPYTRRFFADERDESTASARAIVPHLIDLVGPRTVADVGCGTGTWARVFADHGLDVIGFDGEYVDRDTLLIDRFRASTSPAPWTGSSRSTWQSRSRSASTCRSRPRISWSRR